MSSSNPKSNSENSITEAESASQHSTPTESNSEITVPNTETEYVDSDDYNNINNIFKGHTQNDAVSKISGLDDLKNSIHGLFAVKELGFDVPWSQLNTISDLDRGTSVIEQKEYDSYFLIIPKYFGTCITFYKIDYLKSGTTSYTEDIVYRNKSTSKDYALLLTLDEDETIPYYYIRVSVGTYYAEYYFTYDGKGDRPQVQVLPKNNFTKRQSEHYYLMKDGGSFTYTVPSGDFPNILTEPESWNNFDNIINIPMKTDNGYDYEYRITMHEQIYDYDKFISENEQKEDIFYSNFRSYIMTIEYDSPTKYIYEFWRNGHKFTVEVTLYADSDMANYIKENNPINDITHFAQLLDSITIFVP